MVAVMSGSCCGGSEQTRNGGHPARRDHLSYRRRSRINVPGAAGTSAPVQVVGNAVETTASAARGVLRARHVAHVVLAVGAGNPATLVAAALAAVELVELQLARLLQICGDHPQVLVFAADTVSGQDRQAEDGVGQLVDRLRSRLLRFLKPLFRDQVSYVSLLLPLRARVKPL